MENKNSGSISVISTALLFAATGLQLIYVILYFFVAPSEGLIGFGGYLNVLISVIPAVSSLLLALFAARPDRTPLLVAGAVAGLIGIAASRINAILMGYTTTILSLVYIVIAVIPLVFLLVNAGPRSHGLGIMVACFAFVEIAINIVYMLRILDPIIRLIEHGHSSLAMLQIAILTDYIASAAYYLGIALTSMSIKPVLKNEPHVITAAPRAAYHKAEVKAQYLDLENELLKLKQQYDARQLSDEEYARRRAALLSDM